MDTAQYEAKVHAIKVHFFYIIIILGLFIVFLAANTWTDKSNFTEYLTNAGTMVSLVLALLAIFYAYISNDSLARSLGQITGVAGDVSASKQGIAASNENLKKSLDEIGKVALEVTATRQSIAESIAKSASIAATSLANTEALDRVSKEVSASVASLGLGVKDLTNTTMTLMETVVKLPDRIDDIEKGVAGARAEIAASALSKTVSATQEAVSAVATTAEKALKRSSLTGRFFLYACVLSLSAGKKLHLEVLSETLNLGSIEYLHGYGVAANACGVIDFKAPLTKMEENVVVSVDEYIKKHARSSIVELIPIVFKDKSGPGGDKESTREAFMARLASLEKLFGPPAVIKPAA